MTYTRWPLIALLAALPLLWMAAPLGAQESDEILVDAPPISDAPAAPAAPAAGDGVNAVDNADATGEEAGTAEGTKPPASPLGGSHILLLMAGAMAVMWFFSSRSRKKQDNKRREMLASLSKGDKVTSIGGIVGTVMDVREDEVLVKVDETSNTRMKFARWAIRGVGEDAKKEEEKR